MRERRTLAAALVAPMTICALAAAHAQAVPPPGPLNTGTVLDAVKKLKPGDYIWAPQIAPTGPVLLIVNIATQRAVLYRNGLPVAVTTVSTGKPGFSTPTGVFTILQKEATHFSNRYNNAPMPYMQRLTWGGVALHGGGLPGYPASHGCVRLPKAFARLLFAETQLGMTVMVVRSDVLPLVSPVANPLGDMAIGAGPAVATPYFWRPENAPTGAVSIIMSGADRTVRILRNGKLIGSAAASLDTPLTRPWLFQLQSVDATGRHWVRIALPGQDADLSAQPTPEAVHVDERFKQLVVLVLTPGTTVILTPDAVGGGAPASSQPLLESE